MKVTVITPPAPIVSWAEVKAQGRIDSDAEKSLVESYIAAATAWFDGPAGWLARCLGEQVVEVTDCAFGNNALPLQPAVEILSIKYLDAAGVEQTMPEESYRLLANGSVYAQKWPVVGSFPDAVRVRYRAGYPDIVTPAEGSNPEVRTSTVPAPLRQAILMLAAHWFKNRETVVTGTIATSLPFAVEALASPYRRWPS